jgi:hypothetical protein
VNLNILGAAALAAATVPAAVQAEAPAVCAGDVYPADGVHSVGEDFDAVHSVDQDLHNYYAVAGRSLDWLTSSRQLALIEDLPLDSLLGVDRSSIAFHAEPVSRHQAMEASAPDRACVIQLFVPQVWLERGGLATRSLRVFGVVRRYAAGRQVQTYSGYASTPMTGFQLRSPADAEAATNIVETAYRNAVETLLRNALNPNHK